MEYRVIVKETVTKMVFVEAPTEPEAGLRVLKGEGTILKVHTTDSRVEDIKDIASSEQPFARREKLNGSLDGAWSRSTIDRPPSHFKKAAKASNNVVGPRGVE